MIRFCPRAVLFCLGLCFVIFSQPLFAQNPNNRERDKTQALITFFREKGIPFEARPLLENYGGFSSSLHVRIGSEGTDSEGPDRGGTFVLAVPLGSAFAVETARNFIEAAQRQGSPHRLLVAFLGDEKSRLDLSGYSQFGYSHKGLRDLITLVDIPGAWVVCYLEADAPPYELVIRHGSAGDNERLFGPFRLRGGSGDYVAPLELVRPLPGLFKAHSIPASFEVRYNELYKLGLARGSEELALLWEAEINGLFLYGSPAEGQENPGTNVPSGTKVPVEAAELAHLLLDYATGVSFPLQTPDRHYTQFTLGNNRFFLSEKASVIALVSTIGALIFVLLVYSIFRRVILLYKILLFLKYSWVFLIFLPLMIFIIRGTGLFYAFLLNLFKIPIPESGFWGSILIILSALWLFFILSLSLDFFRFPRKTSFYGISAIILSCVSLFVAAYMDFTFMYVFLTAFIFSYLAAALKNPALVFIFIFLIPLRALLVLDNVRELQGLSVYFFILSGGGYGTWIAIFQAAVLCVPIILLLKRNIIIINRRRNPKRSGVLKSLLYRLCVLGILITLMILQVLSLSRKTPQQSEAEISGAEGFTVSLDETFFLESRIVNVRLESQETPLRFDLFLESEDNETPLVYSAPVPQERQSDNSLRFILGENPPNPLELEIVLRRDFRGSFRGAVIYESDSDPIPGASEARFLRVRGKAVPLL